MHTLFYVWLVQIETDGTQTQINPNGNRVVKKPDGSSITYLLTGQEVHQDPSGRRKQINPDGSVLVVEATKTEAVLAPVLTPEITVPKTPIRANSFVKQIDPKQLFDQHLQDAKNAGIPISSQKKRKGTRKVVFKDGGKLMLSKDGVMIHKYADGKKVQCTPDGKLITVSSLKHFFACLRCSFHILFE